MTQETAADAGIELALLTAAGLAALPFGFPAPATLGRPSSGPRAHGPRRHPLPHRRRPGARRAPRGRGHPRRRLQAAAARPRRGGARSRPAGLRREPGAGGRGASWPDLRARFAGVELHLVGPLQSNKLARALELFDAIHSLDRDSLARKLAAAVQARGACPALFVQVNTGREPQKAGVDPDGLDALIAACRGSYGLPVLGLMAIPPEAADPVPHFQLLAALAARHGLSGLSMGMSGDFEAAIACGATHVRLGSALFGDRPPVY